MFKSPYHQLLACCFWLFAFSATGVVKNDKLIVRWTFDEGSGSVTNDVTGGGLDLLLSSNAKWGSVDINNTAISKYSLDLMEGDSYGWSNAHDKIKALGPFSYLVWFKTNGQPDAYSQLVSKKEDGYSSYFVQIEPDGRSLKTLVRSYGTYYDNGVIPFSLDEWHQLVFTFDGTEYNTFMDGEWIGNSSLQTPIDSNDGQLGIGGTAEGSSLFKGWIDDVRFYSIALNAREVNESYGQGAGDFGAAPHFTVDRATSVMPVNVSLSFLDSGQDPILVSDLNISDFEVDGGSISNFQTSGLNYTFDLNSTQKPQRITVELPAGTCKDDQNISNSFGSVVIFYGDIVTKAEDLVGWWKFDELNGTEVPDSAGTGANAILLGNAVLDTESVLGTNSLKLDGDGDAAKVYGLKRSTPANAYRFEDLQLWWPLDGNLSDMSSNGRNATAGGQQEWEEGRYGQAFTFTGNDHIEASNPLYRGITGTAARTLSMWIKTTDKNWRTLAYWGHEVNGQRWWFRLYRNQIQMHFRNAVRRAYVKNIIDGLWHHVAVVNPVGGNHRNLVRLYLDGNEVEGYGQWGDPANISTGVNYSFRIGKRWDNNQRFVGAIDDVRLYSADFSEFEIQKLVTEASGLPIDQAEDSYTLSVWAKPNQLTPVMDYKFATGWYEGNGGEYMQAKLAPGRVDESEYNSMYTINPTDSDQSTVFPYGLSEKIFDGSFGDSKINDIDGRGWRFGQDVLDSQINRTADANFSVLTEFPTETLDPANDDFLLWEQGGSGVGAFVGFKDGHLRIRAGAGGSAVAVNGGSTSNMAVLDIAYSELAAGGFTDGKLHDLRWEMKIGGGVVPGRVRLWIDDILIGESNTTGGTLSGNSWSGGDAGGFGKRGGSSICVGESENAWPFDTGSSLLYHYGTGFMVDPNYVAKEDRITGQIEFTGPTIDQKSGGLTGTDTLGALWYGKLRIANDTFLRSGENTFGTRSDDGSALWIDLDRDGDFSRTNADGLDEMIVNNLGGHGARNRVGTVFLGYKAPLIMRVGHKTNPGISAGTGGLSTAYHATPEGESLAVGSDQLKEGIWNHLALVINREEGEIRHFLNGKLVGADEFTEGTYGDFSLGDWYFGGIPGLSDFNGSIDDARIYSSPLSDEDIAAIFNGGAGDMGVVGTLDAPVITQDNPISINLSFSKVGSWVVVTGLDASEINASLTGGSLVAGSFAYNSVSQTFSFQVTPDADATEVNFELPAGAGSFGGEGTLAVNRTIGIVPNVLSKSEITNWWWFNESLGTLASDSVGDNDGNLMGGTKWAADAIEGTSVQFEKPGQVIDLGQVSPSFNDGRFQLSFWFKRKEEGFSWSPEQISNVMLSLGDVNGSTMQIGTNGESVEVFMATAVRSQRVSLGSGVSTGKWHHLLVSYDENASDDYELKIYLDGKLSGFSAELGGSLQVKPSNQWLLGAASKSYPTNGRFMGLLDDMRFYSLDDVGNLAQETYNRGNGDLVLTLDAAFPANTHTNPIYADLTFKKYGIDCDITDFNQSRISITNGTFITATGSGASRRIEFNSTIDPGRVNISLLSGLGVDASGAESNPLSFQVGYARPLTRVENLTAWWSFDENNGTIVTDYMNGFEGQFFSGDGGDSNVTFDTVNAKFGSALRFPKNAWVETNALASSLGVGGGDPRTIAFWIFAESGQNGQTAHMVSVNAGAQIALIRCGVFVILGWELSPVS
jgi:hypothetical protein